MKPRKPFEVYILMFALLFLSAGGFFGGITLICDPSGAFIMMSPDLINNTPFTSYLLPAIILILFLGVFPAFVFAGLTWKPSRKIFNLLNVYKNIHWSWTYSLYTGIILVLWMDFEIMFVGYHEFIQTFYSLLGVLIIILSLMPGVREHYKINENI